MGRQHGERKDNSPPKKAAKIDTFSAKGINFLFSHLRMTLTFKKYKGRNSDDFKYLRICSMLGTTCFSHLDKIIIIYID